MIPIEPPKAAEIAPCTPASQADSRLTAAVNAICNPNTGRKTCHTLHPAAKNRRILRETSPSRQFDASQNLRVRSDRNDKRIGRHVRVEHADLLPEMQPPGRDGDAVVIGAREEVFAATLREGPQDVEVGLRSEERRVGKE